MIEQLVIWIWNTLARVAGGGNKKREGMDEKMGFALFCANF